jgi:zinc transporter 1
MDDDKANKSKKKKASMNMHGVFLHVLADALGSIVVIISALLIKFVPHDPTDVKHWTSYIDPTLSIIIVTIITISTIPLFKETSYILLQTIPRHIEINQIKAQLLENVPEINGIHELHVWRLTNEKIIASAHLNRKNLSNYMSVADKVQKFFHSIGIHSITIQYECECDNDIKSNNQQPSTTTVSYRTNNNPNDENKIAGDCLLRCENDECDTQTCCTKDSDRTSILLNNNNNNNTMEVFAISQPDQNENPLSTQISMNPSVLDEKL